MLRMLRLLVAAVFVGGIAGMIVNSIKDNNNGAVVTFGLITAVTSLMLISFTFSSRQTITVDEALAQRVEGQVARLVGEGADETELRSLVRDAVRLGRGR